MECVWEYLLNCSIDATIMVEDNYLTKSFPEILLQSPKKPNPRHIILANTKSQQEYLLISIVTNRREQNIAIFSLHVHCINTNDGSTIIESFD